MKPRMFVVEPIPEVALDLLREVAEVTVLPHLDRQISTDELVANAKRCDFLDAMGETIIPAEVINANPELRGLAVVSRKAGNIDLDAARARRLPVAITHPADAMYRLVCKATCDLTMAMILALAYRLVDSDRFTAAGSSAGADHGPDGSGVPGQDGGFDRVGPCRRTDGPADPRFEMKAIYTKRHRLPPARERELGVEWVPDKDAVLRGSDFVCIECDYNPSTHLLIGAREFGLMKRTASFINTARGRIVDEKALIQALKTGTIAGAALDVYWNEPPVPHDPAPSEELYT